MGRLIDADICLNKAWHNFYKQEVEHEKNIDGYDILHDRLYEQSGFECCQQTIVNAPTVEAISKDQINKAIEKIEQYICDVETDTVKAQGMAQALDIFEQALGETEWE